MAKMAEVTSHETYRDRTRQEYEERRADGRLIPAQRTCETLDDKSGKSVRYFKARILVETDIVSLVQRTLAEPTKS